MRLRPYRPSDFDPLTILWRIAREKSLPDFQRRKGHFFYEDRDYFRDHILPANSLWVAVERTLPAGFIAIRDDFIDQFYVHPDSWRRGIGTRLLERARKLSPRHLWLYTLQVNTVARRFYEKHGFVAERLGLSPEPESEPDVEYHWRA